MREKARALLLLFVCVASACGQANEGSAAHPVSVEVVPAEGHETQAVGRAEPAYPADMPSMVGCTEDSECGYTGRTFPISPCCDAEGERAFATAFLEARSALRSSGACEGVQCAPIASPMNFGPNAPGCRGVCVESACELRCDVPPSQK